MVNPAGEAVYAPPVYASVPVNVTACVPAAVHHGEPEYEIAAVGKAVIVTKAVAITAAHPPEAGMV